MGSFQARLDPHSWELLSAWTGGNADRLFPLSPEQVESTFLDCAGQTGLAQRFQGCQRPLTVDCLRYAFATHCCAHRIDPISLMALLAHSYYSTTESYLLCASNRFLPQYDATTSPEAEP